jgi:hypothetical protein
VLTDIDTREEFDKHFRRTTWHHST